MPPPLFYESRTMTMTMQKPFDVSAILEEIVTNGEEQRDDDLRDETSYAPVRARTGSSLPPGRDGSSLDRRSFAPGHQNPAAAVSETRYQEVPAEDTINPAHYRKHPSGIECIEVVRHLSYNMGTAIACLWRHMDKHEDPTVDLKKAMWHIDDEIRRLEGKR